MPSRVVHDLLKRTIETSDVHIEDHPFEIEHRGVDTAFSQIYQGAFPSTIKLRKRVYTDDLRHLPHECVQEFVELLYSLARTGDRINISRRFQGVMVTRFERVPSPETFRDMLYVEFICDSINEESGYRTPDPDWRNPVDGLRQSEREEMMRTLMGAPTPLDPLGQRPVGVDPVVWGQKTVSPPKKKKEDHFDEDLFNI